MKSVEKVMYLEHLNITVNSIEKSAHFLGIAFPDFVVRGEGALFGDPSLGRWSHFGNDRTYLALQEIPRTSTVEKRRPEEGDYRSEGVNHIGFSVSNVDEIIKRLATAGYEPSDASSMHDHPYRHRVYFTDECGTQWEFVQYLSNDIEERNDYTA